MSAVSDLREALAKPTPGLPFHLWISRTKAHEILRLAELGEHAAADHICEECDACVDCEDGEPNRCSHGKVLCASHWPGLCWACQAEAEAGAS